MIEVLLVCVSLALVVACGAFVAAEFSFVTVDRSRVEREAEAGDRHARGIRQALKSLSTQLSAAQVGITVTNLVIGFLAQPSVAALIEGPLGSLGVSERAVAGVSLAIAFVLANGITMIFGELVPKNLAIANAMGTAKAVQGFQRGFTRVIGPLGPDHERHRQLAAAAGRDRTEGGAGFGAFTGGARLAGQAVGAQGTLEGPTAELLEKSLEFGDCGPMT